jgi:parvulin-like peptidyl-prolyl isomerase
LKLETHPHPNFDPRNAQLAILRAFLTSPLDASILADERMKLWLNLLLGAVLIGGSGRAETAPGSTNALASGGNIVNGVVAIVGDQVITRKDLFAYVNDPVNVLMDRYRYQPDVLRREVAKLTTDGLEHLVERKLILQEFKTAGYIIPESLFEDELAKRIREKAGDRTTLVRGLRSEGQTFEWWKEQVREDLILILMHQFKVPESKIIISPHRVEKYYAEHQEEFKVENEYKLRIIMINHAGKNTADGARKLAEEILAKLDNGASFAEMAGVYSEDTYRAKGGDRDWVELEKEHYQKQLDEAIRKVKPGQHSGVIETGEASWIVLVEEFKPAHFKTLSEVHNELESTLKLEERKRLQKQWVERLKAKSFVRYF